jgi:hypothetical protein
VRVALLFIDGVGIGPKDPSTNPLAGGGFLHAQFLDGPGVPLPDGSVLFRADTTFGLPGRPQSASNQTAIYTGVEAPRLLSGHVAGYPTAQLRALIDEQSIVRRIRSAGRSATSANAFPSGYLDAVGLPWIGPSDGAAIPSRRLKRLRASAGPLAMAAGGVPLRTLEDARAGRGLTHDIDGGIGRRFGWPLPTRTAAEAAQVFWDLAEDFTLFEHFLADAAGHARDSEGVKSAIASFDAFARALIATRPGDCGIIICADHGNAEDVSTRNHTTHPVAVMTFGLDAPPKVSSVADVGKLVLWALGLPDEPARSRARGPA